MKTYKKILAPLMAATLVTTTLGSLTMPSTIQATSKLKLSSKNISLFVGQNKTISANLKVTWNSSNKKIVSVKKKSTKKGILTAKKAGSCKITATSGQKKAVLTVTVKKKNSPNLTTSATATPIATSTVTPMVSGTPQVSSQPSVTATATVTPNTNQASGNYNQNPVAPNPGVTGNVNTAIGTVPDSNNSGSGNTSSIINPGFSADGSGTVSSGNIGPATTSTAGKPAQVAPAPSGTISSETAGSTSGNTAQIAPAPAGTPCVVILPSTTSMPGNSGISTTPATPIPGASDSFPGSSGNAGSSIPNELPTFVQDNTVYENTAGNYSLTLESASATAGSFIFTNNSNTDTCTGLEYSIEQNVNGSWIALPCKSIAIPAIAMILKANKETPLSYNWSNSYGALEAGTYRLVKSFSETDFSTNVTTQYKISCAFTITE